MLELHRACLIGEAASGPLPPLASRSGAALQLHKTCHSFAVQHSRKASDRVADKTYFGGYRVCDTSQT